MSTGTATASDSSGGSTSTTGLPSYVPAPGHITAAGRVLNDGGRIYAGGAIQLDTPQVDNHGGTLTTTSLSASGPSFSNAGGTLNVSQAFSASVDRFDNTGGTLRAGSLQIASTGELVNTDGQLESSGDASLAVGGGLANTRGTVSAAGALLASVAGALDNTGGQIVQSGGDATRIAVAGALNNNAGIIGAAGNATVTAGALRNDTGRITAMGNLSARVVGAATNISGTLTANGNATFAADTLDNTRGSVAAVRGELRVTTHGQTLNEAGRLQAGGAVVLANGGLANTAGLVAGHSVAIDSRGSALKNTQGIQPGYNIDPGLPTQAVPGTTQVIEVPARADWEIQQYVTSNTTTGGGTNGVPPWTPYAVSRDAIAPINTPSIVSTAKCANGSLPCISGVGVQQNTPLTAQQRQAVGAYFGKMSTDYQRAAALATATGNVPVTMSFEIAAGVAGLLEQAFSPSAGKVLVDTVALDFAAKVFSERTGTPLFLVNEIVEREIKPKLQDMRDWIDSYIGAKK